MSIADPIERIETARIGEIMIPLKDYPTVTPTTTLREAMEIIRQSQLVVEGRKSLPRVLLVLDDHGRLKGTVRRRDIMRGLEPRYLVTQPLNYRKKLFDVSIDPNLSELSGDKVVNGIREQAKRPISDVMRPIEIALDYEDHIIKGVYEMVGYGLTLLPVMKEGRLAGVIRTVELFNELCSVILES
jgi:predicted transcriptional regulator